ncbi:YbhB/YbcL family Raf kinase inhibitor-like protein [Larsenimonas suaedae]|uniref:YbhB/YbcL family Raf kinase inhibitor-like protein n=1 Tax=Larsenimonas suaedae TaxID=1851019 RepID=A0ABU1GXI0_9GAMM|nr:YbhB/YbcL family Raf kinase inhibitor-like protein [Larsenimonas suaedae]MCM2973378.1 YbhB/YbcL family Raf kinase inhibitor-like protein [Larsenimonas suaedae]MDR5896271.1 YbhB/YbcL family Raf kinase inhibitor-like protein [Larsenimonas suaedae]
MANYDVDPLASLPEVPAFTLTSPEFEEGGQLTDRHKFSGFGLGGENMSPALSWSGFPEDTKSFVLSCFDPDAPNMSGFWHWTIINLPPSVTSLEANAGAEGALSSGFTLNNDYSYRGFGGAAPPPGDDPHRYVFVVHALDVKALDIPNDATPALATFALGANVIARATLTGYFGLPDA